MSTSLKINSFDQTPLHAYQWESESVNPSKIVVIIHGMMEHAKRYERLGQFLSEHNIATYAYDQRGHGQTTSTPEEIGKLDGNWDTLVKDATHVLQTIATKHPNIPIFVLGHSMGSYVAQHVASVYGHNISGLILSGTSKESSLDVFFGSLVASFLTNNFGPDQKATLIHNIIFSGFNKHFSPAQSPSDWLTRDTAIVDAYLNDPYCGQICSNNFYKALFEGLKQLNSDLIIPNVPSELPILIIHGKKDPLSKNGKTVDNLIESYQKAGHITISHRTYPDARHEILNEINRDDVFQDILNWI